MKNYIEEKKRETIEVYKTQPARIVSDYRREKEYMQGYHGRELLELIQNADDELTENQSKEVCISFHDDILTISNCGTPFSKEGVDSLMISNISDKKSRKKKVIGNKGTGFRAILGWAEKVMIHSGELHIAFSEEYSQKYLKSAIDIELGEDGVAILAFPEWIQEQYKEAFTTSISIKVKDDENIAEDIETQMKGIDGTLLLFLNMTESICINTDNSSVKYVRTINNNKVIIEKYEMGSKTEETIWLLNRREEQIGENSYTVAIAYRLDGKKPERQVVYNYFPTEVDFPYPVLLHANLNLDANRNHLLKGNEENKLILDTAATLLVDTALKLTEDEKTATYDALSIVIERKVMHKDLCDYNFQEILLDKVRTSKILPTVEEKYIAFSYSPVFYKSKLATVLKGEKFSKLLKYTDDKELVSYICSKTWGNCYNVGEISIFINDWTKDREISREHIEENVVLINALIEEFRYSYEKPKVNLLFCTDGYQAEWATPVYIKEKKMNVTEPPEFINMKFMDSEMKNELERYLGRDARTLVNRLPFFNIKEYNVDKIIEKMNVSIEEKIKTNDIDTAKKFSNQCLDWIWKNRNDVGGRIRIFLLTREGNLKKSDKLYIGNEYGNKVCEDLFYGVCTNIFVEDIRKKLEEDHEDWEILDFLKQLSLAKYPRKIESSVWGVAGKQDYENKFWGSISFPIKLEKENFSCLSEFDGTRQIVGTVTDVEYLSDILNKSSTQAIVAWINNDKVLSDILFSEYDKNAAIKVCWGKKRNFKVFPKQKVYSYIRWRFQTSRWIEVGEKRYDISSCILKPVGEQFAPLLVQPDIDNYIKGLEGNKKQLRIEYENIFKQLGVYKEYDELSIRLVYLLLYNLPKNDREGKIASSIYKVLAKSQRKMVHVPERGVFLKTGSVWGNHGYQKVADTFYLDKRGVCKNICDTYNLIDLPVRLNSEKIEDWFGIKKLVLRGNVIGEPQQHQLNKTFENDFQKYKIAAFCYRIDNNPSESELHKIKELSVVLCVQVKAEYNGEEVVLEDYDYISEDGEVYYLQVPNSLQETGLHSCEMGIAISNILCDMLNSVSLYEKFRDLYMHEHQVRKKIILDDIVDETIFERSIKALSMYKNNKEEFLAIVKGLARTEYDDCSGVFGKIDYEHLSSIANASLIIDCFRMIGTDIAEYNTETTTQKLSLLPYYRDKVEGLRTKYREQYKNSLFNKMKMESIEEKKKLVDKFLEYENCEIPIMDSVLFDCEQIFMQEMGIELHCKEIDLNTLFKENQMQLERDLSTTEFLDDFLKISVNASLLYYAEFEILKNSYEAYVNEQNKMSTINNSKDNLFFDVEVFKVKTVPNNLQGNTPGKKRLKLGYSEKSSVQKKENADIGFKGEEYAYKHLKSKYRIVSWVSENARKAKENPEGSADFGYDMEYLDSNEKKIYVEVKASVSDVIEFHMTSSEYNFAKKHSREYIVLFVARVMSDSPEIYILDDVITENGFNTKSYSVREDEYTITAKVESRNRL